MTFLQPSGRLRCTRNNVTDGTIERENQAVSAGG
jgi:hypothetical protein